MSTANTPRIVTVDNVELYFPNIAALELRIDAETHELFALIDKTDANSRNAFVWKIVERQALIVRDLIVGLESWLTAEDTEIDQMIDNVRNYITDGH